MGSSGLLLVGVVLLWVFGAMPHWVRRSEALALEHAAADPAAQRTVTARRRAGRGLDGARADDPVGAGAATSSSGILGRPRRDDGPQRAGATAPRRDARLDVSPGGSPQERRDDRRAEPDDQRSTSPRREPAARRPAPRPARRVRRGAPAVPAVVSVASVAGLALLAVRGASTPTVVLAALALAVLAVGVLLVRARRAAVRRRALARRRAAARPWLAASTRSAAPGRRPAARRLDPDEQRTDRRHAVGA